MMQVFSHPARRNFMGIARASLPDVMVRTDGNEMVGLGEEVQNGLDLARTAMEKARDAVVVEGYVDAVMLHQARDGSEVVAAAIRADLRRERHDGI